MYTIFEFTNLHNSCDITADPVWGYNKSCGYLNIMSCQLSNVVSLATNDGSVLCQLSMDPCLWKRVLGCATGPAIQLWIRAVIQFPWTSLHICRPHNAQNPGITANSVHHRCSRKLTEQRHKYLNQWKTKMVCFNATTFKFSTTYKWIGLILVAGS